MLRCFVALDLPDAVKDELSWLFGGVPSARWLDEEDLHVTLRFVGEVEGHVFGELCDALERVRQAPFELSLGGVGHFPPRREARSLWVGVERAEPLVRLRSAVDRAIQSAGQPPERRKYHPHVTVARLDGASQPRVGRWIAEHALYRSEPFEVDAFHVYSSQLHPKGALYTLEETFPLRA